MLNMQQTSFVGLAEASKEPNLDDANLMPDKLPLKTKAPVQVSLENSFEWIVTFGFTFSEKKAFKVALCTSRPHLNPAIDCHIVAASHFPPPIVSKAAFSEQPKLTQEKRRKREDSLRE